MARSNVCPEIDPPDEPSFYAFSFVRPIGGQRRTAISDFVIAGGAEARGGAGSYPERIVRYRDLSPDGWKEKVGFTVREMESRLAMFGFGWSDTTATQAYTVHDFHPVMTEELVRRGADAIRPDLALCPAAGGRSRIRDGLPKGEPGDGDLIKRL